MAKRYLVIPSLLLLLLFAALPAGAVTTIQYQYNWYASSEYNDAFVAMIDEFNQTHPDIQVEGFVVPGTYDKLLTNITAGTAADVVNFESSAVIEWAARGLLEPLDRLYTSKSLRDTFFEADANEVIWAGHVWGQPGYTNARGLFWNTDIFNEIGLDSSRAPATMDELEALARKGYKTTGNDQITRVGFVPWLGSYTSAGWFWSFGGDIYDPETGLPTLEKEENAEAWHWIQDWAQRFPPNQFKFESRGVGGAHGYFLGGSMAAVTAADNSVKRFKTFAPDLNFLTGRVPHPTGGRNGSWGGGIGHIIPKGAKHPREAQIFLKWLGERGQQILYERLEQFPTNRQLADDIIGSLSQDDPRMPLFMQMGERNPRPPVWANVIGKIVRAERDHILTMESTPEEVLKNLQVEVLPLYEMLQPK